jgi:DnaK suppressor protein
MTDVAGARSRLEDERRRLAEEIEALVRTDFPEGEPSDSHSGRGNHMAEDASDTFEHEKSLALLQNLRSLSANVESALAKVEKGTYGICDDCGSPIAEERLAAIPYATLCISCKSKRERR